MSDASDGRVVIVTGGGRGLGRAHALELSAAGARVVVNDTGVELDGRAGDPACAARVVEEIGRRGGVAVADVHDVSIPAEADALVDAAVESFGRVDALVNNAGILHDRTFAKMSARDWDEVVTVHLSGGAHCTRAAWPQLRRSGTGRVVFTTSASGLYGQFGQANYAAAKSGMIGLVNVLTQEGARDDVLVNAIAPIATTRMTEPLLPAEAHDGLAPGHVSKLVAYLASAACRHTGRILEVGGGLVARVRVVETPALELPRDGEVEALGDLLDELDRGPLGSPYATSGEALDRIITHASRSG